MLNKKKNSSPEDVQEGDRNQSMRRQIKESRFICKFSKNNWILNDQLLKKIESPPLSLTLKTPNLFLIQQLAYTRTCFLNLLALLIVGNFMLDWKIIACIRFLILWT